MENSTLAHSQPTRSSDRGARSSTSNSDNPTSTSGPSTPNPTPTPTPTISPETRRRPGKLVKNASVSVSTSSSSSPSPPIRRHKVSASTSTPSTSSPSSSTANHHHSRSASTISPSPSSSSSSATILPKSAKRTTYSSSSSVLARLVNHSRSSSSGNNNSKVVSVGQGASSPINNKSPATNELLNSSPIVASSSSSSLISRPVMTIERGIQTVAEKAVQTEPQAEIESSSSDNNTSGESSSNGKEKQKEKERTVEIREELKTDKGKESDEDNPKVELEGSDNSEGETVKIDWDAVKLIWHQQGLLEKAFPVRKMVGNRKVQQALLEKQQQQEAQQPQQQETEEQQKQSTPEPEDPRTQFVFRSPTKPRPSAPSSSSSSPFSSPSKQTLSSPPTSKDQKTSTSAPTFASSSSTETGIKASLDDPFVFHIPSSLKPPDPSNGEAPKPNGGAKGNRSNDFAATLAARSSRQAKFYSSAFPRRLKRHLLLERANLPFQLLPPSSSSSTATTGLLFAIADSQKKNDSPWIPLDLLGEIASHLRGMGAQRTLASLTSLSKQLHTSALDEFYFSPRLDSLDSLRAFDFALGCNPDLVEKVHRLEVTVQHGGKDEGRELLREIITACKELKALSFIHCGCPDWISQDSSSTLWTAIQCRDLKELKIDPLNGTFRLERLLRSFTKLKKLDLRNVRGVDLEEINRRIPSAKTPLLAVNRRPTLMRTLRLQFLSSSLLSFENFLPAFKNLRALDLYHPLDNPDWSRSGHRTFQALIDFITHLKELEELTFEVGGLVFSARGSDDPCFRILGECPKIKVLQISGCLIGERVFNQSARDLDYPLDAEEGSNDLNGILSEPNTTTATSIPNLLPPMPEREDYPHLRALNIVCHHTFGLGSITSCLVMGALPPRLERMRLSQGMDIGWTEVAVNACRTLCSSSARESGGRKIRCEVFKGENKLVRWKTDFGLVD